MRRYLSTLHKRSDRHKKNFALAVSGGVTLLMFGLWFFINYGDEPVVAVDGSATTLAAAHEVSPLESLTASAGESWQGIRETIASLLDHFGSVDVEKGFDDMKTRTLNTYGQ